MDIKQMSEGIAIWGVRPGGEFIRLSLREIVLMILQTIQMFVYVYKPLFQYINDQMLL